MKLCRSSTRVSEKPRCQTSTEFQYSFFKRYENPPLMNCMALSTVMPSPTVSNTCRWSGMPTKSWSRNFRPSRRSEARRSSTWHSVPTATGRVLGWSWWWRRTYALNSGCCPEGHYEQVSPSPGAKAQYLSHGSARLKPCPDTNQIITSCSRKCRNSRRRLKAGGSQDWLPHSQVHTRSSACRRPLADQFFQTLVGGVEGDGLCHERDDGCAQ